MKKGLTLLLTATLLLGMLGIACAVPYTWTDNIDFSPDILVPPTHSYFHDISDGPDGFSGLFYGGNDTISGFSLDIGVYDDNVDNISRTRQIVGWNWWLPIFDWVTVTSPDGGERAKVSFGLETQTLQVSDGTGTFDANFFGALDIWHDGTLNVKVFSDYGDFYLDYSNLTVTGDNGDMAPVPEPGTLLLLGSGIAGLALYRRKKAAK